MNAELVQLGRIIQLASEPEVELADFIEAVGRSPSLATDVIRISNSCLYGLEGEVSRLDRATLILGFRTVTEIAASVLTARRLRSQQLGSISGSQLWMHSLQIAIASELVARSLSLSTGSEAYLTGLLHDIGIVELYEQHGPAYAELLSNPGEETDLVERERELLGTSHADWIGERAMEWGFPQTIAWALAAHHAPSEGHLEGQSLAAIVRAAHSIVGLGEAGWTDGPIRSGEERSGEALDPLLDEMGLGSEDVADIRQLVDERLKESAAIY